MDYGFKIVRAVLAVVFIAVSTFVWAGPKEDVVEGLAAGKKDKLDEAIHLFTRAIESGDLEKETFVSALNNRGVAYRRKGSFDRAIDDYTRAIELAPDFAGAYSNRGLAYAKYHLYDQGIEDLTRAINIDPDNADSYLKRGNAYFDKGEYEQAIADFNSAIVLEPELALAYQNRSDAYREKQAVVLGGSALRFASCFERTCVVPDNWSPPRGGGEGPTYRAPTPQQLAAEERRKGEVSLRERHYLEAIQHFRNALEHSPGNLRLKRLLSQALSLRGKEAASFGNFDETISLTTEALKYTPGDQHTIGIMREAYLVKMDVQLSVKHYDDAIDLARYAMKQHIELRNDPALLKVIQNAENKIHEIEMEKFSREEEARKQREEHARTEIGDRIDQGILSRIGKNEPQTRGNALKQLEIADEQGKAARRDTSPWGEGAKHSSNVPFDDSTSVHADGQYKIPPIGNAGPIELAKIDRYLDKNINSLEQQISQARNPAQKSKFLELQVQMLEQQTKVLEQSIQKEKDPIKRSKLVNKQTYTKSKKQVKEIELLDFSVQWSESQPPSTSEKGGKP